ncbi:hypothetical protein LguiA_007607 [Lonicera macranthoides]
MDHLHVSKTKFRHPAPDVFSRRKANDDNSQHTTTDFQVNIFLVFSRRTNMHSLRLLALFLKKNDFWCWKSYFIHY